MTARHPDMRELLGERQHWRPGEAAARDAGPVVALSRQHGAGGLELARALGERLGLRVFERELVRSLADSAHLSETAVSVLDEHDRSLLDDWLASLNPETHLTPYAYLDHLKRVVHGIARQGGAVIVGRGAHLILPAPRALRVFVVAPLEVRVGAVAARERIDAHAAARRIEAVENQRRAFLRQYFHADFGDPCAFDLVVNTAALGIAGGVDAVAAALLARQPAVQV
jgi:cytidylate kinase